MALSENEPGHPGIGAEVEGGDHVVAVHQEVALWVCLHCLQFASCPVQTSNCLHLPLHNNSLKEKGFTSWSGFPPGEPADGLGGGGGCRSPQKP